MNNKQEKASFKTKLENFWYYYKTPVILAFVFLCILTIYLSLNVKSVKTDLNVALVTSDVVNEGNINFEAVMGEKTLDSDEDGESHITITRIFLNPIGTNENDESTRLHLESLLADRGAVLFIFDRINFEEIIKKDAFCALDELMDITPYADKVAYRDDVPVALNLKGSKLLAEMGFTNDDLYAAVLFKRPEDAQNSTLATQYQNGIMLLSELVK